MSPANINSSAPSQDVELGAAGHTREQERTALNWKSGRKVAGKRIALSKADARFWLPKLFKWEDSPNYSLRVQFRGKRMTFSLGTGNKEAAARSAARIYSDLLALGVEATIAKHRAQGHRESSSKVATIGEWIEEARGVSASNSATFAQYAASLRLIAGQILSVRKTKKRFGPRKGGAQAYRQGIDAVSLETLSPQAVQRWRLAYVAKAGNPARECSRMTSANSTIRQARSLFADKIVRFLPDVQLPSPRPFSGVEFFPKQSARYFSRIDPQTLLRKAQRDLAEGDPPAFLAMLLALTAGLRRGEIDSLAWHQIDFDRALIRVEATESATLKTADARGEVPIDPEVAAILRGFRPKATASFVIEGEGGKYGPRVWGRHYRADAVFARLNCWLRKHGVTARKPLHELRKELGALITAEHGIYAASRVLRHSSVATTAAHYTDLKTRPTIPVGAWLKPDNVVPMPGASKYEIRKAAPKRRRAR